MIVLGPTGVGKSAVAIKLAKEFNGEIINCDSMQVYQGFDIGTDKLPLHQRENIPHHLLDIINPHSQFTAAEFVNLAMKAIHSILRRKRFPLIAGGTGLYLKALIDGLFPESKKDPLLRLRLQKEAEEKGLDHLRKKLMKIDPVYCQKIGKKDKMRIIRALEVYYATKKPISEHFMKTESSVKDFNIIKIGLKLERNELYKKIEDRVDDMFEKGLIKEVENLLKAGSDKHWPPFRALGYKHVLKLIEKELSLEEAIQLTKRDTRHYAKRQLTWFRKMAGIHWFSPHELDSINKFVSQSVK